MPVVRLLRTAQGPHGDRGLSHGMVAKAGSAHLADGEDARLRGTDTDQRDTESQGVWVRASEVFTDHSAIGSSTADGTGGVAEFLFLLKGHRLVAESLRSFQGVNPQQQDGEPGRPRIDVDRVPIGDTDDRPAKHFCRSRLSEGRKGIRGRQ